MYLLEWIFYTSSVTTTPTTTTEKSTESDQDDIIENSQADYNTTSKKIDDTSSSSSGDDDDDDDDDDNDDNEKEEELEEVDIFTDYANKTEIPDFFSPGFAIQPLSFLNAASQTVDDSSGTGGGTQQQHQVSQVFRFDQDEEQEMDIDKHQSSSTQSNQSTTIPPATQDNQDDEDEDDKDVEMKPTTTTTTTTTKFGINNNNNNNNSKSNNGLSTQEFISSKLTEMPSQKSPGASGSTIESSQESTVKRFTVLASQSPNSSPFKPMMKEKASGIPPTPIDNLKIHTSMQPMFDQPTIEEDEEEEEDDDSEEEDEDDDKDELFNSKINYRQKLGTGVESSSFNMSRFFMIGFVSQSRQTSEQLKQQQQQQQQKIQEQSMNKQNTTTTKTSKDEEREEDDEGVEEDERNEVEVIDYRCSLEENRRMIVCIRSVIVCITDSSVWFIRAKCHRLHNSNVLSQFTFIICRISFSNLARRYCSVIHLFGDVDHYVGTIFV
ncbi:hypothetical protein DFA_02470 [Cavenderia fasciculata]|uniref:Uncharacterized protein n=1 Tax=Cavenderia fasciculata TaxID=261658 RepID=F4PZJ2_CACFS|nr:uncharacterized protein DFA_02470 [Cavenderia fasciculata]EGG19221.1 hypothetical protein DFA_02470 [Cavenderia fasciculata]|eukprot:XP_004366854.1 hypothetical protein DFA_02470 [Cavenderia fasciculata]